MPCLRPGMPKPPPGFEAIQARLDEWEEAMQEAVQTPSAGILPDTTNARRGLAETSRTVEGAKRSREEPEEEGPAPSEEKDEAGDAFQESKVPPLWRMAQINRQRTRYVSNAFYREKLISREVFDYCCEMQLIDSGLAKRWRLPGYEKLCCTACGVPGTARVASTLVSKLALPDKELQRKEASDTNSSSTCLCRVPASQRRQKHFGVCMACGCSGCSSSHR